MAESMLRVAPPRPSSGSTPPHCAICLGTCQNKCYSDSCMHEFCYKCLLEWSKIKPECPLCKQTFKSIMYNIRSAEEYDEHIVERINVVEDNHYNIEEALIYLPPAATPALPHQQYHFRTTFTVDTHGEHAIQQMLLSHPLITISNYSERYSSHRRRRADTSTTFRRSIYNQNLWVVSQPDFTGRYREVSAAYFRNNPAARTRLVPWLNRELNALLFENTQHVMHLVDIIMDHLLRHHICSSVFRTLLSDYLGQKTDHFIHEFYNFMRSPYDMIGYDRHVSYNERRAVSPVPLIDISDNDDSDVILVSSSTPQYGGGSSSRTNAGSGLPPPTTDPVVIDLVDTDSDEPIIVSEEQHHPPHHHQQQYPQFEFEGPSSHFARSETPPARQPILPLKLRIKNSRHKNKERRKRRHRRVPRSSSCSSTSSSSSSSDDHSSYRRKRRKTSRSTKYDKIHYERISGDDDEQQEQQPQEQQPQQLQQQQQQQQQEQQIQEQQQQEFQQQQQQQEQPQQQYKRRKDSSDEEDNMPLSKFLHDKKKRKERRHHHSHRSSTATSSVSSSSNNHNKNHHRHKSHTITSNEAAAATTTASAPPPQPSTPPQPALVGSTSTYPYQVKRDSEDSDLMRSPEPQRMSLADLMRQQHLESLLKDEVLSSTEEQCDSPSDHRNMYVEPQVRSKVKDVRSERPGPSNGRLRNLFLRKEEASNLWYSRPCAFESDSSD